MDSNNYGWCNTGFQIYWKKNLYTSGPVQFKPFCVSMKICSIEETLLSNNCTTFATACANFRKATILGDIVGLVPDYHDKANITIK